MRSNRCLGLYEPRVLDECVPGIRNTLANEGEMIAFRLSGHDEICQQTHAEGIGSDLWFHYREELIDETRFIAIESSEIAAQLHVQSSRAHLAQHNDRAVS